MMRSGSSPLDQKRMERDMPVAFSAGQIAEFGTKMMDLAPASPTPADLETAHSPVSLTFAASEWGAVINFAAEDGRTQMIGLDPVIALQLLQMLVAAVEQCDLLGDDGTFNTQETIQ
jgi:hypothetical protein